MMSVREQSGSQSIAALFRVFPELGDVFLHQSLIAGPTPVETVQTENGPWLFKRDDLMGRIWSGSKARKLEFIFPELKQQSVQGLVTTGMWGSNHALCLALTAREHRIPLKLILGPQPITPDVQQKLLSFHALGAELSLHSTLPGLGVSIAMARFRSNPNHFYLAAGGSTFFGILGFVNGFFELMEQRDGVVPSEIVLPIGTGGSCVGLIAGAALAGCLDRVSITGVSVTSRFICTESSVLRSAKQVYQRVRSHLRNPETLPLDPFTGKIRPLQIVRHHESPGYGVVVPRVGDTIKEIKNRTQIQLDHTYSGKAMQYVLDDLPGSDSRGGDRLFWLTYGSHDLIKIIESHNWTHVDQKWRDLPPAAQSIFKEDLT